MGMVAAGAGDTDGGDGVRGGGVADRGATSKSAGGAESAPFCLGALRMTRGLVLGRWSWGEGDTGRRGPSGLWAGTLIFSIMEI